MDKFVLCRIIQFDQTKNFFKVLPNIQVNQDIQLWQYQHFYEAQQLEFDNELP